MAKILTVVSPVAYFVERTTTLSQTWSAAEFRASCVSFSVALYILWKVWEAANVGFSHSVPSSIIAWVMAVIRYLGSRNRLNAGIKPVWRASLGVTGIDAELHIFGILGSHGKGSRAWHEQRQLG